MPKLTKRVVDALQPPAEGELMAWDTELKGFGVRLMSSGVGSYILKYRNQEGRPRKLALGRVGALTPDEARAMAKQRLGEIARGEDPSAARGQLRKSLTVGELCDLYLADAEHRVKASTLAMDRSRIERHVKPLVGTRSVLSLTPHDVAKLQADVLAGKTAAERKGRGGVTRGGKGAASRTVGMLGTILEFGVSRGVLATNPARKVAKLADGKQRRFLSLVEVKRLGEALRGLSDDREEQVGLKAVRFLLLSGCRRMEALAMKPAWVDAKAICIRFPDTKSGAQIRPLGPAALRALQAAPTSKAWMFPSSRGDGHFVGLPKVLQRACKRAKLEDVTVHVLRHSYAAAAAEMGFSELTIAGLLGHTVPGVTARYAHVPDQALLHAATKVSARLEAALTGTAGADVVELDNAREARAKN